MARGVVHGGNEEGNDKALTFGDIQNVDLRKKMLEAYINEVLTSNSSLAARGKSPMEFEKLVKLASKYMDNKKNFEKSFQMDRKDAVDEGDKVRIKPTAAPSTLGHRNELSVESMFI